MKYSSCLAFPSRAMREVLADYEDALASAMPLKATHRRDLPRAVSDLSRSLTSERGGMRQSYWASPRNLSAYLYYFLPWNLYRLSWLLPELHIPLQDGDIVLDVGCGPLTLMQAFWIARPDLREKKITFVCADVALKPMERGQALFEAMAGKSPWQVKRIKAPLEKAMRMVRGEAKLVAGANVLNELRPAKGQTLEERTGELAMNMRDAITDDGSVLSIEPGTRLGGKMISMLRLGLLEEELFPQSPCPHDGDCPMLEKGSTSWCHFTMPAEPPRWLSELTKQAKMERASVSLSFVHAAHGKPEYDPAVRVISAPIVLPGRPRARYGCSEKGMAMLHDAERIPSGSLVPVSWPSTLRRDKKSGAVEVDPRKA